MEIVSQERYQEILGQANIGLADERLHIGRELSYQPPPLRTVVVHFAEQDTEQYLYAAVLRILELADEWLLMPRYGFASDLGLLKSSSDMAAISFGSFEKTQLASYLCGREMEIGAVSTDLYILSATGHILVVWDHHTADEGIKIQLCCIDDASRLLVALNELGAELELYYADGPTKT